MMSESPVRNPGSNASMQELYKREICMWTILGSNQ
jgi:hypothetical protein